MPSHDGDTRKKATYAWREDHPEPYAAQHRLHTEANDLKGLLNTRENPERYQILSFIHYVVPYTIFIFVGLPQCLRIPLIGRNKELVLAHLPGSEFLHSIRLSFLAGEHREFRPRDDAERTLGWKFLKSLKAKTPIVCEQDRNLLGIPNVLFPLKEEGLPEVKIAMLQANCARGFFILKRAREGDFLNLYSVFVHDTELLLKIAKTDLSLYGEVSANLEKTRETSKWHEVEEVMTLPDGKGTSRIEFRWVYSTWSFDMAQSFLNSRLSPGARLAPRRILPSDQNTSAAITRGRRRKLGV